MRTLGTIVLVLTPILLSAQSEGSEAEAKDLLKLKKELKGTYQIQMVGTRKRAAIPLSLYEKIDSVRKEEELVYYKVSDIMRVKVLPSSQIEAEGFKGIQEEVVHVPKNAER